MSEKEKGQSAKEWCNCKTDKVFLADSGMVICLDCTKFKAQYCKPKNEFASQNAELVKEVDRLKDYIKSDTDYEKECNYLQQQLSEKETQVNGLMGVIESCKQTKDALLYKISEKEKEIAELTKSRNYEAKVGYNCSVQNAKLMGTINQLEAKIEVHLNDLENAAGELMLPIPLPGSDMAKMFRANRIMRGERDDNWSKYLESQSKANKLAEVLSKLIKGPYLPAKQFKECKEALSEFKGKETNG